MQEVGEWWTVMDSMVDGIITIDLSDRIVHINSAATQLLNCDRQEVLDRSYHSILAVEIGQLITQLHQHPQPLLTAEFEMPNQRLGRAIVTPWRTASPLGDPIVDAQGWVIVLRDITADKAIDQMKLSFISLISHELRTPLTSVLGFAKLVQKKLADPIIPAIVTEEKKVQRAIRQVQENMEIVVAEGMRLTALTRDIVDLARMEAGKLEWHRQPVAIADVLAQSLEAVTALAARRGVVLQTQIDAALPIVTGDPDRLVQAVTNLLTNAIQRNPSGEILCQVRCQGELEISITDQGNPLEPHTLEQMFTKLRRSQERQLSEQETGLELPITKLIAEHHGGRAWAESKLGQGTVLFLSLPLP